MYLFTSGILYMFYLYQTLLGDGCFPHNRRHKIGIWRFYYLSKIPHSPHDEAGFPNLPLSGSKTLLHAAFSSTQNAEFKIEINSLIQPKRI